MGGPFCFSGKNVVRYLVPEAVSAVPVPTSVVSEPMGVGEVVLAVEAVPLAFSPSRFVTESEALAGVEATVDDAVGVEVSVDAGEVATFEAVDVAGGFTITVFVSLQPTIPRAQTNPITRITVRTLLFIPFSFVSCPGRACRPRGFPLITAEWP